MLFRSRERERVSERTDSVCLCGLVEEKQKIHGLDQFRIIHIEMGLTQRDRSVKTEPLVSAGTGLREGKKERQRETETERERETKRERE